MRRGSRQAAALSLESARYLYSTDGEVLVLGCKHRDTDCGGWRVLQDARCDVTCGQLRGSDRDIFISIPSNWRLPSRCTQTQ